MPDVFIREATLDDIPHILHHRGAMFWEMGNHDEAAHREMRVTAQAFLRDHLPAGTYRGWLAQTVDGRVLSGAGIAIIDWPGSPDDTTPKRGWIINVYTEPEFRRLGLARRCMDAVVGWCRAEGFLNVSLHASVYGRALYEQMGFQPTNEMRLRL